MNKVADWVLENCSTVGTGSLVLTGRYSTAYITASSAFVNNDIVEYTVIDGNNREIGYGVFNGSNTITRANIRATLVNGTFNKVNPTAISLSGSAIVSCTLQAQVITDIWADLANRYTKSEADSLFALISAPLSPKTVLNAIREYSTPGANSWTKPSNFSHGIIILIGGGQSGDVTTAGSADGGNSGATCIKLFKNADVGSSLSISVGQGGAARVVAENGTAAGLAGTDSTISTLGLTAGGALTSSTTVATASGGDLNFSGSLGYTNSRKGADSIFVGTGGLGYSAWDSATAVSGARGGGGGSIWSNAYYGAPTVTSGAGGNGTCILFEYIVQS